MDKPVTSSICEATALLCSWALCLSSVPRAHAVISLGQFLQSSKSAYLRSTFNGQGLRKHAHTNVSQNKTKTERSREKPGKNSYAADGKPGMVAPLPGPPIGRANPNEPTRDHTTYLSEATLCKRNPRCETREKSGTSERLVSPTRDLDHGCLHRAKSARHENVAKFGLVIGPNFVTFSWRGRPLVSCR